MYLHHSDQRSVEVIRLRFLRIKYLDRICPTGYREDWSLEEILRELDGVKCCGRHNQLEVRTLFYRLREQKSYKSN